MRRIAQLLLDLAAVTLVVACILHFSRRRAVDCSWDKMRAACKVEVEDSLGRVERESIEGIRSAAYRSGSVVGLVTDAEHHGEHALFGTSEVKLDNDSDAARLHAFASDHDPEHLSIMSGARHPRLTTGILLGGLLVYGVVTRQRRKRRASR